MTRTPHDTAQEFLVALGAADNLPEFLSRDDAGLSSKSSVEYTLRILDKRVAEEEVGWTCVDRKNSLMEFLKDALHKIVKSKTSELVRELGSWQTARDGVTDADETLQKLSIELNVFNTINPEVCLMSV